MGEGKQTKLVKYNAWRLPQPLGSWRGWTPGDGSVHVGSGLVGGGAKSSQKDRTGHKPCSAFTCVT